MNKIFKHKRGASGLKVVCEFAKSHCSSTEKSAINAGDYVASDLKTDKTKYFISGLKTLSIATIFAVAISSIAPVKAIAEVGDDYGAEDWGFTYVIEKDGGLFLYSTKNRNVKYGKGGNIKDGRGEQATMFNGYIASGRQSTVVGYGARGTHNQSTAFGSNTGSYGAQGTAIGNDAYATALGAVAIGNDDMHGNEQDTSTNGKKNLNVSKTYDNYPLTEEELKNDNLQQALYNVFCSKGGSANDKNGKCTQDTDRLKSFGLKYDETQQKYVLDDQYKTNAGQYSLLLAGGQGSISIGSRSISVGEGSTALGVLAKAYGDQSTALGTLSKAMGKNSFALGANSTATQENSMAFGVNSSATMKNSIAIGYGSKTDYTGSNAKPYMPGNGYAMPMADSVGVVSVGSANQPRRIINLAAGALDTDAVNVAQLKSLAENFGVDDLSDNTDKAMRYLSVNRTAGEAKTLQDKIQKEKDFKTYAQYRKYHDLMSLNNKKSGTNIYDSEIADLDKKIKTLETKYSDFKTSITTSTELNNITTASSDEVVKKVTDKINEYGSVNPFPIDKAELKKHNATNEGATGADALAFGYDAKAEGENAISIGKGAQATGKSSINIGGGSVDNIDKLQKDNLYRNILIGGNKIQNDTKDKSNKINTQNKMTKINQTTIIGSENKIDGTELDKSIIMGSRHEINQKQPSTSKLGQNVIIGEKQIIDDSEQATTIGNDIVASGARGGVAIGGDDASTGIYRPTKIEGKASIAMGTGAQALKEGAMSLGLNSEASGVNSTALGKASYVTTEDGVALGSKSFANTDKQKKGLDFSNGGEGASTAKTDATWQSTLAAVSIGGKEPKPQKDKMEETSKINTRQITNLAAGTQDTDAVNVAQLKSLATYVSQGFKVKGKGNGNTDIENTIKFGSTLEFASNNDYLKVTHTKEANGNSKFTFDIDKDKLKQELGNVGGGTGGATASNLKFKGDIGDFTAKNEVNIKGGATEQTKLSENNIGVVSDNTNTLNVKLAKELKNLTSAKFESAAKDTTTIEGGKITLKSHDMTKRDVVLSEGGLDMGGNKITNLNTPTTDTDGANKKYVDDEVSKTHFKVDGDTGGAKDVKNGNTIKFAGDGNIKTSVEQDNQGKTTLKFALNSNNLNIGKKTEGGQTGEDGKVAVNGKDGSSVVINGKDGSIGLNGKDGITIKGEKGGNGLDGQNITRIVYTEKGANGQPDKTHKVATLDDGLKFAGNAGNVNVKLNQKFEIKGADSNDQSKWDRDFDQGKNIMTKVEGSKTTIGLSKNLTGLNSATFESTINGITKTVRISDEGIKFKTQKQGSNNSEPGVSIDHKGINMNNQKITNLADATSEKDAVNKGQLDKEIEKLTKNIQNGSNFFFNAEADTNTAQKVENGKSIKFAGDGENNQDGNIKTSITTDNTGKTTVKFALNETDLKLGGKNGKNGKMTVKGADGSSVEIDGAGGKITAKGNGNNVTIDGKAGSIGLIGSDKANATISVKKDGKDLNDADITRLTYVTSNENGKNPTTHQLATLDDGLKFAGNNGTEIKRKLNEKLTIKGGAKKGADTTDENIWVEADAKTNSLTIKMAKALKGLTSAEFTGNNGKTIVNGDGITYTSNGNTGTNGTVSLGKDGINAGGKAIQNVKYAENPMDAVNKKQMEDAIKDGLRAAGASALTLAGDSGEVKANNNKLSLVGGQANLNQLSHNNNIGVVEKDGKLNIKLAKDIEVDSVTAKNKITVGEGTNKITIADGKISGVQSSLDPNLSDKLKNIDADTKKSDAEKAKEKKAAIQDALQKAKQDNVATVGDLKNVTNGLDSVVENVTNITNNITNITNMVANSDDKKKIDEASKAIEEYKKDQNDKNKQKAAEDAINANKIKTYNPYGTTVKNNTTIVDAIKNINERGVKFMHISDSDKVGENDDLSVNNNDSQANKKGSIGIGMNAVSDGTDAIATGTDSKASGANAIAMGKGAQAMGENTISIGTGNKVTGKNSGAIGDPATLDNVNGVYSMGNNNFIQGSDNVANTAKDIFAIGNNIGSDTKKVTDKANGSVILGSKGYSNVKNGVALGYGSNADRDALTDKTSAYNGNDTSVQNTIKGTYGAVSVGDKDNTRQIINVAAGKEDSDAVNVAQLKAVANQIKNVSGGQWIAVSNGAKTAPQVANNVKNAVAVGDGSVANRDNTFSVGSAGNERIISNVADGVAPTDAANMRQLQSVANMVGEVKKDAMAGTASAMAIGNLPQATIPGKGMMAVGVGFYKGEQATALGVSKMSENGKWVFKASASYDSQRNVGAAGAIGFHF